MPVSYTHLDVYKRQVLHKSVPLKELSFLSEALAKVTMLLILAKREVSIIIFYHRQSILGNELTLDTKKKIITESNQIYQ